MEWKPLQGMAPTPSCQPVTPFLPELCHSLCMSVMLC